MIPDKTFQLATFGQFPKKKSGRNSFSDGKGKTLVWINQILIRYEIYEAAAAGTIEEIRSHPYIFEEVFCPFSCCSCI